ncbi:Dehydrogenase/reductase SDR family member on chromosome X [Myotis davidii]|uniref:Dehydrogenase/reductase SDR family member on chromosome X n=1 Tax=Myotis davidii TaxID=225400 RepID=L5MI69_MYODS|nr:Dehydrogenase/reductase SDR family member on chromosome X [Myotis davidii]
MDMGRGIVIATGRPVDCLPLVVSARHSDCSNACPLVVSACQSDCSNVCPLVTPDEGAWTSVYAAVTPDLEGVGGRYLYNEKDTRSLALTYDPHLQQELWARSCQMTGVRDRTRDPFLE